MAVYLFEMVGQLVVKLCYGAVCMSGTADWQAGLGNHRAEACSFDTTVADYVESGIASSPTEAFPLDSSHGCRL